MKRYCIGSAALLAALMVSGCANLPGNLAIRTGQALNANPDNYKIHGIKPGIDSSRWSARDRATGTDYDCFGDDMGHRPATCLKK